MVGMRALPEGALWFKGQLSYSIFLASGSTPLFRRPSGGFEAADAVITKR
jgi:hypothetical protein